MDIKKNVLGIVSVVFLLLGALFGVQIMNFIFGNLGPEAAGLTEGTAVYNTSLQIQNESLNALVTYSEGASTQMNIITIVIVIALLIGVFALVWNLFMGKKEGRSSSGGNFGQ